MIMSGGVGAMPMKSRRQAAMLSSTLDPDSFSAEERGTVFPRIRLQSVGGRGALYMIQLAVIPLKSLTFSARTISTQRLFP